jgi:hypothetical protein
MINQYILEPFARAYHPISDVEHHITEEVIDTSHRLRHRVGLRLISLGEHLSNPQPETHLAA